jgi:fumarate hydratase subunit alpha
MAIAQKKFFLRASLLSDPLFARNNTGNNTPVTLHLSQVPGDQLKLLMAQKGGGAENMSRLKMFNPSANDQDIAEFVVETVKRAGAKACPPLVVGLGIGGNFETCALLANRALFDPLNSPNPAEFYARMEQELLEKINATEIGAQGMGGVSTCLAVKIRTAECHIASLPVAVNLQCHAHRHIEISI